MRSWPVFIALAQTFARAALSWISSGRNRRHGTGGCYFAETPDRLPAQARLFWAAEHDPQVPTLEARSCPGTSQHAFDLLTIGLPATLLLCDGHEELLLRDRSRPIRASIVGGTLLDGPVHLIYRLPMLDRFRRQDHGLRCLAGVIGNGRIPSGPFPSLPRDRRRADIVRALDAMALDLRPRTVAVRLFGEARVAEDWSNSNYMKLRVKRLMRQARRLAAGAYLELLSR